MKADRSKDEYFGSSYLNNGLPFATAESQVVPRRRRYRTEMARNLANIGILVTPNTNSIAMGYSAMVTANQVVLEKSTDRLRESTSLVLELNI